MASRSSVSESHSELRDLRNQLQAMYSALPNFNVLVAKPPILYSSHNEDNAGIDGNDIVIGLRGFTEAVKRDLDVVDKFLARPDCASLPPLSTNAPYLIAVYEELINAPQPVLAIWKSFRLPPDPAFQTNSREKQGKAPNVKIDVVAAGGQQWIRVNTVKNSRLMAELREIDSYDTESSDESDSERIGNRPSLAQRQFDNSLLRSGRELIAAAQENPCPNGFSSSTKGTPPSVVLRLPRLNPDASPSSREGDIRIGQTISKLRELGLDVRLGESQVYRPLCSRRSSRPSPGTAYRISHQLNLDLSILIAVVSDLTHSPLPHSAEDAETWFVPQPRERPWRKERSKCPDSDASSSDDDSESESDGSAPNGVSVQHSRALTYQALQEMSRGMIEEMADCISALSPGSAGLAQTTFWVTPEARERCLRIVEKIGGPGEKRRAHALFVPSSSSRSEIEAAVDAFWEGSRYNRAHLPLIPLSVHSNQAAPPTLHLASRSVPISHPFFRQLADACRSMLLSQEAAHLPAEGDQSNQSEEIRTTSSLDLKLTGTVAAATTLRAHPRLTVHTVESMLLGAMQGWTTVTANKSSVRAMLRWMKSVYGASLGVDSFENDTGTGRSPKGPKSDDGATRADREVQAQIQAQASPDRDLVAEPAALWVFAPRSLAEEMRRDFDPFVPGLTEPTSS